MLRCLIDVSRGKKGGGILGILGISPTLYWIYFSEPSLTQLCELEDYSVTGHIDYEVWDMYELFTLTGAFSEKKQAGLEVQH